jgi:serine/threonine protein kinase
MPEVPGYEVQDRLGAGGMGEVYRARCRPDGRVVAIKIEGHKALIHTAAASNAS